MVGGAEEGVENIEGVGNAGGPGKHVEAVG
jgi:hypothetical protein